MCFLIIMYILLFENQVFFRERPTKVESSGGLVGIQPIPTPSPTQITRIQESAKTLLTNRKLRI